MEKPTLSFNKDGEFRIMQITDMHASAIVGTDTKSRKDIKSYKMLRDMLEMEKPDLVAFTGDITKGSELGLKVMDRLNEIVEEQGIPYTFTYGNHESDSPEHREALADHLVKYPLCIFERGPETARGTGNYSALVNGRDGRPAWALYHIDCHCNRPYTMSSGTKVNKDDFIDFNQIDWFKKEHARLTGEHGRLPSLCFCHVPLWEFNEVWMFETCYGTRREKIWCPPVNSGFFQAMWETGDVRGYFAGHDHVNSFHGRVMGVLLAYGRNSGYHCKCERGFKRGVRMINLKEGLADIEETYIALHDGTFEREEKAAPPAFERFEFYWRDKRK